MLGCQVHCLPEVCMVETTVLNSSLLHDTSCTPVMHMHGRTDF